ncbi:alpha/beta fold hydrolase [Sphingoaurantiacus capsulatus]|uniref:Alpha/beta fold hydrolase n=1 Tax=Sphingoaurantiacus capsulatus TaxID=1771310 RepID=A0ABV7XDK4_9SPHN
MNRRDMLGAGALLGTVMMAAAQPAVAAPAKPKTSGNWVTLPSGHRLFMRDWGEGTPVVFLAGWTLTSESWAYQMAPLAAAGHRCIAYDRRGQGRSDDPGAGYDYDTLADDLAAVLDALNVKGATVVAHSMSGGEVVRYLSRHGGKGRIAKVIFLATTLPCLTQKADNPTGVPAPFFDQLRGQFATDFPAWIEGNADPFVVPATSPLMRTWIKSIMLSATLQSAIELNRAMTAADFRAELAKLSIPVLFIHGDKDASAPLPISAGPASKLVRGAKLSVYEGAPHGLFVTHVARLNADIAAFARG